MCILAQLLTAGVVLPAYFVSHILNITTTPVFVPSQGLTRARTLLPAVILGYLLPSWYLVMPPTGTSLDGIQIISAIWQPFPLYITALWMFFRFFDATFSKTTKTTHATSVLAWIRWSYYVCGAIATAAHLTVFWPSVWTAQSSHSFANVFIPYWMHSYLAITVPSEPLAAYRPCSRLLFQHDWLIMTMVAIIFFARSHIEAKDATISMRAWTVRMLALTLVGGPGAAITWAAITREERIAIASGLKLKEM